MVFEIEIPLSSKICAMVNFVILFAILSMAIMLSGSLAGYANHAILLHRDQVHLSSFDLPVIGGGLVMQRGWRRNVLIWLRVSVLVVLVACNLGLEGTSRVVHERREILVRQPNSLNGTVTGKAKIMRETWPAMRCGRPDGNTSIVFGALLNGTCYNERTDYVYVRRMGVDDMFDVENFTATSCSTRTQCDLETTVFQCRDADIVCVGVERGAGCGRFKERLDRKMCAGVVYNPEEDEAYLCDHLRPEAQNTIASCRYVQAKRADVSRWTEYYSFFVTMDLSRAVFAAAYAVEVPKSVSVPVNENKITVLTLWWALPLGWAVLTVLGLATCVTVNVIRGNTVAVHDERGLVLLLDKVLKTRNGDNGIDGL